MRGRGGAAAFEAFILGYHFLSPSSIRLLEGSRTVEQETEFGFFFPSSPCEWLLADGEQLPSAQNPSFCRHGEDGGF